MAIDAKVKEYEQLQAEWVRLRTLFEKAEAARAKMVNPITAAQMTTAESKLAEFDYDRIKAEYGQAEKAIIDFENANDEKDYKPGPNDPYATSNPNLQPKPATTSTPTTTNTSTQSSQPGTTSRDNNNGGYGYSTNVSGGYYDGGAGFPGFYSGLGAGLGGSVLGGGMLGGGMGGGIPIGGAISAPIGRDPNSPYSGGIGGDGLYGGNQQTWEKYYADLYAKNHAADPVPTPATGINTLIDHPDRNGTITTWDQLAQQKAQRDAAAAAANQPATGSTTPSYAGQAAGSGSDLTIDQFRDLLNGIYGTSGTTGSTTGTAGTTSGNSSSGTTGTGTGATTGSGTGAGSSTGGAGQGSSASTSGLPAEYQRLLQQYTDSYNSSRNANEARYQDILRGYNQLIDSSEDAVSDRIGTSRRQEIADAYTQQMGKAEQDLISRGLGGTTIRPTVLRGIASQKEKDLNNLEESLAKLKLDYSGRYEKDKLDFMERRTDQPVDLSQMIALYQAMGAGGVGASSAPTTPVGTTTTGTMTGTTGGTTTGTTPASNSGTSAAQQIPATTPQQQTVANAQALSAAYAAQNAPRTTTTSTANGTPSSASAGVPSVGYPSANVPGYVPQYPAASTTTPATAPTSPAAALAAAMPRTPFVPAPSPAGTPTVPSITQQIAAMAYPYTPPTISTAAYNPTSGATQTTGFPTSAPVATSYSGDARTSTGTRGTTATTSPLGYSTVQNPGAPDVGTDPRLGQPGTTQPLSAYAQALQRNMTGSLISPIPGMPGSSVIWPKATTTPSIAATVYPKPAGLNDPVSNPWIIGGPKVTRGQSMLM